jgi:hypothetical protein
MGTCLISGTFKEGVQRQLEVATCQAVVILAFNDVEKEDHLTFEQLQETTGLEE